LYSVAMAFSPVGKLGCIVAKLLSSVGVRHPQFL